MTVGTDSALVALVEFGSHTCPICRTFALDDFPGLQRSLIEPGRVLYRYVDLSPRGVPTQVHALLECLEPSVGFAFARPWGYQRDTTVPDWETMVRKAALLVNRADRFLARCTDSIRGSDRLTADKARSRLQLRE